MSDEQHSNPISNEFMDKPLCSLPGQLNEDLFSCDFDSTEDDTSLQTSLLHKIRKYEVKSMNHITSKFGNQSHKVKVLINLPTIDKSNMECTLGRKMLQNF